MYLEFFQLNDRPFTSSPFAPHYFGTKYTDTALQLAQTAVDEGTGPVIVIGGTGVGKSMLLAVLAQQYEAEQTVVSLACTSLQTRADLLKNILFELDRPYQNMDESELRLSLFEIIKRSDKHPHGIILLVDEAQSLNPDLIDELRSITNIVRGGQSQVRLVLAGTAELEETLTQSSLASFNQRIAVRCYLQPMTTAESISYIDSHLRRVGRPAEEIFEAEAIDSIVKVAQGIPRLINQLCCHSMILAASESKPEIDHSIIAQSWMEIQQLPGPWQQRAETSEATAGIPATADADEDWDVIEFGELGENIAEPDCEVQIDSVCIESTIETINKTQTSVVEIEGGEQPIELDEKLEIGDEPEPPAAIEPSSVEPETTESIFGDNFHAEEVVTDDFTLWTVEQNRSSLDVSEDQLISLLASADDIQQQCETATDKNLPEIVFPVHSAESIEEPEIDDPQDVSNPDPANESGNSEFGESISSTVETNESTLQIDQHSLPITIEYPIQEHDSYQKLDDDSNDQLPVNDDREMLVVSHVDTTDSNIQATPSDVDVEPPVPSKGKAVRMEYSDLFDQLRTAQ